MSQFNPFNPFSNDFTKNFDQWFNQLHQDSVQKYVQDIFNQGFGSQSPFFANKKKDEPKDHPKHEDKSNKLQKKIFETHDDIYVLVSVPKNIKPSSIKIYYTPNKLIIKGIPHKDKRHTIILPCLVKKKGAKTSFKNHTLQIRLPKASDYQMTEIILGD